MRGRQLCKGGQSVGTWRHRHSSGSWQEREQSASAKRHAPKGMSSCQKRRYAGHAGSCCLGALLQRWGQCMPHCCSTVLHSASVIRHRPSLPRPQSGHKRRGGVLPVRHAQLANAPPPQRTRRRCSAPPRRAEACSAAARWEENGCPRLRRARVPPWQPLLAAPTPARQAHSVPTFGAR